MKLGQILVRKRLLDGKQLKTALDAQLIYGGTLGTCLIEHGFISEQQLGEALEEACGLTYARRELFRDVQRFVIQKLPARLVQKHSVLPFRLHDKVLDVAMVDPRNLQAVDELSFAAGHTIRPWVAPEARIYQAMERYYDIPRRQRYLALCRMLDETSASEMKIERLAPESAGRLPRSTSRGAAPLPDVLENVADLLCRHESPKDLADTVLSHVTQGIARSLLFKVVDSTARLWRTSGVELDPDTFSRVCFPIISEPIFGLLRGESFYRGPVPDEALYDAFYAALNVPRPAEVLIVPVYMDDRLVALFHGDGGPHGAMPEEVHPYVRIMKKLGLALNMVMIRRQIRSA